MGVLCSFGSSAAVVLACTTDMKPYVYCTVVLQVEAEEVDEVTVKYDVATVPTFVLLQVRWL